MSAVEQLDQRAQELRAQGLTYREVGEEMGGEPPEKAWKRCHRESAREQCRNYKAEHREELREYERRYGEECRYRCPKCGYKYGTRSGTKSGRKVSSKTALTDNCPGCIKQRRDRVVKWWAEGLSMKAIAVELGWTVDHLTVEFVRMREAGFDLPYRRAVYPTSGKPRFPDQVPA